MVNYCSTNKCLSVEDNISIIYQSIPKRLINNQAPFISGVLFVFYQKNNTFFYLGSYVKLFFFFPRFNYKRL